MKTNNKTARWVKKAAAALLSLSMAVPGFSNVLAAEANTTEARVSKILESMSVRDKITQMIMPDFRQWQTADQSEVSDLTQMNDEVAKIIEDYNFGAVILFANNVKETEQTLSLTKAIQAAATKDGGLPVLITTDQEGGSVARLGSGTSLPGNMALGANGSLEDAKKAGEIIGSELSVLGINTSLSPVVDVNNNPNNPVIGLRSFGDDAQEVGQLASAVISGMDEYNVIGCAKHFPGHGDVATDSHYGLPIVEKSKDELKTNELKPYEVAISQGIDMIMTAHILYPGLDNSVKLSEKTNKEESLPSTLNKGIITDLLKGEMKFEGVVSTDAMNMEAIADVWTQRQAMVTAMEAGADLICMPTVLRNTASLADLDACIDYALEEHEKGNLTDERLNDANRRILTLKAEKGILDYDEKNLPAEKAAEIVGGKENRQAEREISARAVTVVRNENNTLPLDVQKNSNVVVFTPYDNEPALCVMAWNRGIEAGTVPAGAKFDFSVYTGMSELTDEQKAKVSNADYVIAVTEVSAGRVKSTHWSSVFPNALMDYAKSMKKKGVIMSASTPYDVQDYQSADAVMAVYGNKGSGTDPTEALVGSITSTVATYGPNIIAGMEVALGTLGAQGKLPVAIPVRDAQKGVYTDEVAFARKTGLTYPSKEESNRESMHRLYNPNSGEHFYTSNEIEYKAIVREGWKDEGIGWVSPKVSPTPVYRLYNPNAGDHHFTTDSTEKDYLLNVGWRYEGIAWHSASKEQGVPVYRQYNPNAVAGSHNYTLDEREHNYLGSVGWNKEGIAWYALKP